MKDPLSPKMFFALASFAHANLFSNCSYVWQALSQLQDYLAQQKLGDIPHQYDSVHFVNKELISIGEGTVIEPGAYIKGPCIIGKNCQIRHGAYIRGNVIIGDHCVVGHTTEVKHSILLNHAKAAHFAFIGDSILGNDVNLGAGVKCANLRLDGIPIIIRYESLSLPTGLRKFGSIIGDGSQIGCNVVLNPGTLVGKETSCFPNLTLSGVIGAKKRIKPVSKQFFLEDV